MMTQLPKPIRILAFAFLVLTVPATRSSAQAYGYGYGYPGFGYGYGYPGFGYGYGYPSMGYYGYGGGLGFGLGLGYGYSPTSYGYFGNAYPPGLQAPFISGVGDTNPLMGLGLTPLGVQSALAEGTLLRGSRTPIAGRPGVANPLPRTGAASQYSGTGAARPR
ncbi:hypothetical protein [Singulisphaera acidiphila]|uniref:Uncharacterized protein n=1 Tax=Singulisphaera acidiphila (strain ATCC BAA-1392 / DSM 18658 / VKM B-2454 / MOB10) TaxID=886293 RepID=L0DJ34_SINAD|nr:hypothetical protein [Singulisphaera acidiphila]AGA28855.1 hypothetical protein Sinac_4678 [Singulisphaera acidiphila DSM 18658]